MNLLTPTEVLQLGVPVFGIGRILMELLDPLLRFYNLGVPFLGKREDVNVTWGPLLPCLGFTIWESWFLG